MKQDIKMIFERMQKEIEFFRRNQLTADIRKTSLNMRPSLFEDCIYLQMPDAWEIILHKDGTWSWDNTDGG